MCEVSDPLLNGLVAEFCRASVAHDEAKQGMEKSQRLFIRLRRKQADESAYDAAGVGFADRRSLRAYRAMMEALKALRLNLGLATSPERISIQGMVIANLVRAKAANQNSMSGSKPAIPYPSRTRRVRQGQCAREIIV